MTYLFTKQYAYHVENLRSIERAFKQLHAVARRAIAEENTQLESSLTRLLALLLGIWAEVRLSKLLHEHNFFSDAERQELFAVATLTDRWLAVIDQGFRKHYGAKTLSVPALPHSAFDKYQHLKRIVDNNTRGVIEVRNKLAHGQWIYPFAGDLAESRVSQGKYKDINEENILAIRFKQSLLNYTAEIIQLLVANKAAFERDFDTIFRHIWHTEKNLLIRDYTSYKEAIVRRAKKGAEQQMLSRAR